MEVGNTSRIARELKRPLMELRQLVFGLSEMGARDEEIRAEMVGVTEAAMRQIDDLVKIGELGDNKYALEPVAVRAVCDEAADELIRAVNQKTRSSVMTVKYSNRAKLVMGNRELLKSVVYNFLLDALKYTMNEEDYDTRLMLRVKESKQKIEIEVRDFGPALPKKVWREIQESVKMSLGETAGISDAAMRPMASALGMYVAANFSRYMRAEIGATRHSDGASFFVRLPILKQQKMWGV